MKLITLFLALTIFGLSTFPCGDGAPVSGEVQIEASVSNFELTADPLPHLDLCSPFCSCHCCHTHMATSIVAGFVFEKPSSFYQEGVSKGVIAPDFGFFQPPKL
ncbi:DUF6660 family protein [uncultured Roseivirga sp.]|uniref:DUF6660 family protein n=1 Tax=uncultured Roseivirga sp. TaxID=543088 RepID=UPI0030DD397C|tara:strand:- start:33495 stop:33806 length:312 start_codon:yes stop_codon:yes gene_type:complete